MGIQIIVQSNFHLIEYSSRRVDQWVRCVLHSLLPQTSWSVDSIDSIRFDSIRFVGTNLQLLQPGNLVCLRKTINNAVVFVRIKWNNKHTFPASKNCDDDTNHKSRTAFVGRTTLPRLADTKKSQPRRTVSTTAVTIATRNPIRTAS